MALLSLKLRIQRYSMTLILLDGSTVCNMKCDALLQQSNRCTEYDMIHTPQHQEIICCIAL